MEFMDRRMKKIKPTLKKNKRLTRITSLTSLLPLRVLETRAEVKHRPVDS